MEALMSLESLLELVVSVEARTFRSRVVMFNVSVALTLEPLMVVEVSWVASVAMVMFLPFRFDALLLVAVVSVEV
jgi:hypothetical protein